MISTLPDDHINKQNTPLSVIVQCPVTFSVIACSSVVFIGTVVSIYANFLFRLLVHQRRLLLSNVVYLSGIFLKKLLFYLKCVYYVSIVHQPSFLWFFSKLLFMSRWKKRVWWTKIDAVSHDKLQGIVLVLLMAERKFMKGSFSRKKFKKEMPMHFAIFVREGARSAS
jgi:hypothetical protein